MYLETNTCSYLKTPPENDLKLGFKLSISLKTKVRVRQGFLYDNASYENSKAWFRTRKKHKTSVALWSLFANGLICNVAEQKKGHRSFTHVENEVKPTGLLKGLCLEDSAVLDRLRGAFNHTQNAPVEL